MGYQMTALMQKRNAAGSWENIPVQGMTDWEQYAGLPESSIH